MLAGIFPAADKRTLATALARNFVVKSVDGCSGVVSGSGQARIGTTNDVPMMIKRPFQNRNAPCGSVRDWRSADHLC